MRSFTSTSKHILRLTLLAVLTATPLFAADTTTLDDDQADFRHEHEAPPRLVQIVREATKGFVFDTRNAEDAGYGRFLGCVSGPEAGAMGTHYVNGGFLDGEIEASKPEALMYETSKGRTRLLGVEYIVDAATWLKDPLHNNQPPILEGQLFHLVDAPNRYNIPAFFELHVWAWRENRNGTFVDWNTDVSCDTVKP